MYFQLLHATAHHITPGSESPALDDLDQLTATMNELKSKLLAMEQSKKQTKKRYLTQIPDTEASVAMVSHP